MSIPKAKARPQVSIKFEFGKHLDKLDYGKMLSKFEFKGMVNGGYVIRGKLIDPSFNMLDNLIDSGYFTRSRSTVPVIVKFQLRWGPEIEAPIPESATKVQTAILISLKADGESSDDGLLTFVAIDPPSWYLNMGDGSGKVYKGRVSKVIEKVVKEYAPPIALDIGRTIDSKEGKWWMMRQDPKTFISSLFDWSSSITKDKTQWLFTPDGNILKIKEQASLGSTQRAFYRYKEGDDHDTIKGWEFLADNALSIVQTKLITQGISAISGQYLDKITDKDEKKVFIKDARTPNKKVARIKNNQGFTKPPDDKPQKAGWSSVSAIPEDSAGSLGVNYDEYIDGRPRAMWLNLVNALMRVKIECLGHGEWSSCEGLGTDTVFISWTKGKNSTNQGKPYWWMTGNWLVYGFHHRLDRGSWYTDLYLARFDHDSLAQKVGGNKES